MSNEVQMPVEGSIGESIPDEKMEKAVRKSQADEATMQQCLRTCNVAFTNIRDELADPESDLFKWFVTESYPIFLRLALTKQEQ